MDYLKHPLIDKDSTKKILDKLLEKNLTWEDGKKTAGSHALKVKDNFQLNRDSKVSKEIGSYIIEKINTDPLVKSFSLPKKVHGVMFTATGPGQGYGMHIDNPYMSSGRSDLSFTIFLNEKCDYQGGELCIQTLQGNQEIKLEAGEIIIYPSSTLHCVNTVTHGKRMACVGWIQSYISKNEDRNLLFGLEAGAKALLANHGRSNELDLIFQSYSNLLRRLGD